MPLIDVHTHLIPGIDDGPADLEGALALARAQIEAGITRVVATPHVSHRYPNRSAGIWAGQKALLSALAKEGINLRVEAGAEISASVAMQLDDDELRALRLGESDWLLLEPPTSVSAIGIQSMVVEIQRRGHRILLSHPERSPAFQGDVAVLAALVRGGVHTQVTASALTGGFGKAAERFALELVGSELVHVIAADAHGATHRAPGLVDHLDRAGLGALTAWLCCEMPSMILDGGPEPRRPPVTVRRRRTVIGWRR